MFLRSQKLYALQSNPSVSRRLRLHQLALGVTTGRGVLPSLTYAVSVGEKINLKKKAQ